jgi:hypothetical protein
VSDLPGIVPQYSGAKILRAADVEMIGIGLALKNVDVNKSGHLLGAAAVFGLRNAAGEIKSFLAGLPSRSSPPKRSKAKRVRLRQGYGATLFASALAAEQRLRASNKNWPAESELAAKA